MAPRPLPAIGAPATRALASIGVTSLEQTTNCTSAQLLALHGFGPKALRIVEAALAEHGLTLADGAVADTSYVPSMSAERVEELRRWHEDASAELHALGAYEVEHMGFHLRVPEHVFGPTPTSDLLGREVQRWVRPGQRVLDMGCGAGGNALLAARATDDVVAVDVNPHAVAATAANADRNGLADRVTVLESDVFSAVDGTFDLIVIDPPFRWFAARDLLELAFADEGYRTLGRFMADVRRHLRPGGSVLLFFGTTGDVAHLDRLVADAGLTSELLAERTIAARGGEATYFVRRLHT